MAGERCRDRPRAAAGAVFHGRGGASELRRAAAELHLAQPSLSRQIQRLENRLGVRLLDRTPQGSRLTEAGKAFLPQAQALLHAARQAALTARAYAPAGRVIIGYVEDLVITPAVRELRRRTRGPRSVPATWSATKSGPSPRAGWTSW